MRIDKANEVATNVQTQTQPQPVIKRNSEKLAENQAKTQAKEKPEVVVNEKKAVDETEVIKAIEAANKSVKVYDRRLEYSIHEGTHQIMIKVIDTSGDDEVVIREIPSEKILDMVAKMWEVAGLLVDEKA